MAESAQIRRWLKPQIVIRVAVLLVLGAAMSFGVMVFCVARHSATFGVKAEDTGSPLKVLPSRWPTEQPNWWPSRPAHVTEVHFPWVTSVFATSLATSRHSVGKHRMTLTRTGWPCRCWWMVDLDEPGSAPLFLDSFHDRKGMTELPLWAQKITGTRSIPTRVFVFGFIANSVAYGAVACVLIAAPGLVRSKIRQLRGKCPACAYPIGVSPVCTECGRPVKVATTDE